MSEPEDGQPGPRWTWLGRGARAAGSLAGFGARRAGASLKRWLGAGEAQPSAAEVERLVGTFGELRGAYAKLGQMVGYLDLGLPEEMKRAFARLHDSAPPMPPALVAETIAQQLGAPPERVFARWDPQPLAAASIGQVHRAALDDGTEVAVKVQYPGVEAAIRADVRSARLLGAMMGALSPAVDRQALLAEIEERVLEETDYLKEAANQEAFRALHQDSDQVLIPRTFPAFSSKRVLTSELAVAAPLRQVAESGSADLRNRVGATIFRFAFASIFRHGLFHCDPHPGNYLVRSDGKVWVLDYGCVRRFAPDFLGQWRRIIQATLARDTTAFDQLVVQLGVARPDLGFDFDHHRRISLYLSRPWLSDRPFRFTHSYVAESFRLLVTDNPNRRSTAMPREFVFVNRLQWGLNSVLAMLEAEADWRAILLPYIYDQGVAWPEPWSASDADATRFTSGAGGPAPP